MRFLLVVAGVDDVYIVSFLGMVFLSFPAANVAGDAVEKLKASTVDSKRLFVRVIPNIHVSDVKPSLALNPLKQPVIIQLST